MKIIKTLLACFFLWSFSSCDPGYKLYVRNNSGDTVQIYVGQDMAKIQGRVTDSLRLKSREVIAARGDCCTGIGYKIYPKEDFLIKSGNLSIPPSFYTFINPITIKTKTSCITVSSINEIKKYMRKKTPGFSWYFVVN
ncbi:hypothetical protein ABIB62_001539 [Mucilaginibacter sp. UYP25]|uniref:hypothetical protein n=1 Tax=unclassified Mucilaginibacter TaxID=2617802 RepID=UPI003393FDD0